MARSRNASPAFLRSEEFVEIALSSIEREIDATRDRLRRLGEAAEQLRSGRPSGAPAAAAVVPGLAAGAAGAKPARRPHNMSAEARRKLSERMRKRWDEYRKNKAKAAKAAR